MAYVPALTLFSAVSGLSLQLYRAFDNPLCDYQVSPTQRHVSGRTLQPTMLGSWEDRGGDNYRNYHDSKIRNKRVSAIA